MALQKDKERKMTEYKISEKLKKDLIQHFETKYPMAQVEKIVLELRNLPEVENA